MRTIRRNLIGLLIIGVLASSPLFAQKSQTAPPRTAAEQSQPSDENISATQEELLRLLRTSPKLTMVVARDPSLLADQEYVARNNPALASFLQAHPEISRNPDYYLFNNIGPRTGRAEAALERRIWPEIDPSGANNDSIISREEIVPFLVFLCILGTLIWLIRVLLENRRWNRIFKLQSDVHGKLIEKFGTNQELLTYMETESGKRFLEGAPIPVDFKDARSIPSPIARIITPLQIGVILSLLGIGFLILRYNVSHGALQLMAFGILALMLGLGFIISAGVTWAIGKRLGLMPEHADEPLDSLEERR